MHVLYLHQYFVPLDGSGGSRSYEMARRLVEAGHRVTMITSSACFPPGLDFSAPLTRINLAGIDLRVIDVPYSNRLSNVARLRAFARFAWRAAIESGRVDDVDVVFATSTPLTIAIPAVWAATRHRRPMVFEVRDLWPELPIAVGALRNPVARWLARRLERWAYRHAAHVVALSPGMKDGVVRAGQRPDDVTVISNGCDVAMFDVPAAAGAAFLAEHPHLAGSALIAYTGTLGPINGVEYLVEIAAHMLVRDPSVRFLIVGDGKQAEAVRARARARGVLERNLWMMAPVSKAEMPRLLSAVTVPVSLFVDLPEMWNNSANKFFDALSAGKPVLINYQGWQAEILTATGAGLVVPAADAAAAAALLHALLIDGPRMQRAREAAARLAATEFNRDRLFAALLQVLTTASSRA